MKNRSGRQRQQGSQIPVNRRRWSESSQRTYTLMAFYRDIPWRCRGCDESFTFTAQEQKQAYEEDHVYIHWRPVLCDSCVSQSQAARDEIHRCEERWRDHKPVLEHDIHFLKQWLAALKTYAHLSGRNNDSVIVMLETLIRKTRES